MKRLVTLLLAAGLFLAGQTPGHAIEFKASGQWLMGFSMGEGTLMKNRRNANGTRTKANNEDQFAAQQRLRLQLDAVASESLSGTVFFEIGDTTWGKGEQGGALGADGKIVELKRAYIDWRVPDTSLQVRMGIQGFALPYVAGGSAIFDDDAAAVVASYQFNENVGVTLSWARPYNDNYEKVSGSTHPNNKTNYLDNLDLIALTVPLTFDGIELTPWVMYGIVGQNAFRGTNTNYQIPFSTSGYEPNNGRWNDQKDANNNDTPLGRNKAFASAFWGGLPVKLSLWDPLNIEFEFNYGWMESLGRGWMSKADGTQKRYSTRREGWFAKAVVEYKMDWGIPGILGWYSSGDDSNPGNGSERMPGISPMGNMTSFLGDGNMYWSPGTGLVDRNLSYAGTWGVGIQLRDMSFVEDLKHTFRAVYWGGTNSPAMAKYASHPWGWSSYYEDNGIKDNELYLTTNDGILEFNLVNSYQMYENLEINFELGYLVNFIDKDTWKKSAGGVMGEAYQKQDAWKAQLIFAYSF